MKAINKNDHENNKYLKMSSYGKYSNEKRARVVLLQLKPQLVRFWPSKNRHDLLFQCLSLSLWCKIH